MTASLRETLVFYVLAGLILGGALSVAWSRNIVRAAFALLASFLGVAGLYVLLAADFLAVVQLLVYVGGILVVILFAVMLTARISAAEVSNPSVFARRALLVALVICGPLLWAVPHIPPMWSSPAAVPTTARIGEALLSAYVLPFEVVSVLLLAALVGGVTLARGPITARHDGSPPPSSRRQSSRPPVAAPTQSVADGSTGHDVSGSSVADRAIPQEESPDR